MKRLSLRVPNRIQEIATAADSVNAFAVQNGLAMSIANEVNVCLDEIVNNIISYAYGDDLEHPIDIDLELTERKISVTVSDDGMPFNPLEAGAPDLSGDIANRRIGGVGIHFVRKLMDECLYAREAGRNRIMFAKNLKVRPTRRGDGMEIGEFIQDDVTVVEPKGRIDSATSRALGERLIDLISGGAEKVLVDLSEIAYISSAGFRALLIAAKQADSDGKQFGLCGLSFEVRRLFEIGAFTDLFRIFSSRQDGVAGMR